MAKNKEPKEAKVINFTPQAETMEAEAPSQSGTTDIELKLNPELIAKTAEAYESFNKELRTKEYLVGIDKEGYEALLNFFENDVKWKFTEAMGVKKIYSNLKNLKVTEKTKHVFLIAIDIEATYYFLTNFEGKGVQSATDFTNNVIEKVAKHIADSLQFIKEDRQKLIDLENNWKAAQQGISLDEKK